MPLSSVAQQRKMHALANEGKISEAKVHEWDEATKKLPGGFKGLPKKKKKAMSLNQHMGQGNETHDLMDKMMKRGKR